MLRMSLVAATRQDLGGPHSPEASQERGENLEQPAVFEKFAASV